MKYDPSRECGKCGGVATTRYIPPGETMHPDTMWTYVAKSGVLRRQCTRCGHQWDELPNDAGGASDGGKGDA